MSSCSDTRLPNGSFFVSSTFAGDADWIWGWDVSERLFSLTGLCRRLPGEESGYSLSGKGPLRIGNRAESALMLCTIRLLLLFVTDSFEAGVEVWEGFSSVRWENFVSSVIDALLSKDSNTEEYESGLSCDGWDEGSLGTADMWFGTSCPWNAFLSGNTEVVRVSAPVILDNEEGLLCEIISGSGEE